MRLVYTGARLVFVSPEAQLFAVVLLSVFADWSNVSSFQISLC